jgi:uncharacterized protein
MTAIPTGRFVWFEYVSKDAKKAQAFFGELFNWSTQDMPMPQGAYQMIASAGKTIGGYVDTPPGVPANAHWLTHLQVADAKAAATQIKSLGGKVHMEPIEVGGMGTYAVVADPQGGVFALWQPKEVQETPAPATGSFCWNELFSSDPAASVKFYAAIGGFSEEQMQMDGMGTYHLLKSDNQPRAGIMAKQMPEQPHAWLPYVQVANADATTERAKKLGGEVIVPPTDIPNIGRFSIIRDPQQAALGLLQPAAG